MILSTEHMLAAIESPTLRGLIAQRLDVDEDELDAMLQDIKRYTRLDAFAHLVSAQHEPAPA